MAQNKSSKKSEGLCEKIHNAVSPFRPRIRRISDQPRISVTGDKNSVHNSSPQSKTIPVQFRHSAAHFSAQNSKKESDDEREIAIIRGQKFAKKEELARRDHVQFAKARSKKDEDHHQSLHHEGKFSDYISKFRNRMMKTASHVGGGDSAGAGGRNSTRRDSFNDKVSNYIDQAKVKIRTTTNVGVDQNNK